MQKLDQAPTENTRDPPRDKSRVRLGTEGGHSDKHPKRIIKIWQ